MSRLEERTDDGSYPLDGRCGADRSASASPTADRGSVLIISDDNELVEAARLELERAGFVVRVAGSAHQGLNDLRSLNVSAVFVDRRVDGRNGFTVIEALRGAGDSTPVLAIGALEPVEERIAYIRSDADYLARPFDLREMMARFEALLRRCRDERKATLRVGAIEIELVGRTVRCMGRSVELLPQEFKLLEYFVRHPNEILSREKLLEDVWNHRPGSGRTNVVDVQVGNLRRKLDPTGERRFIVNVRGAGFRLAPEGFA